MAEEKPKNYIDFCGWGKIKIGTQEFDQVIISQGKAIRRQVEKLEEIFGTTHQIGEWEERLLLAGNPEVIIIGSGQFGVLKVSEELKKKLEKSKAKVEVLLTPKAVSEFNRLVFEGKRVNALIHTTC
jgi:hypothetical protein